MADEEEINSMKITSKFNITSFVLLNYGGHPESKFPPWAAVGAHPLAAVSAIVAREAIMNYNASLLPRRPLRHSLVVI